MATKTLSIDEQAKQIWSNAGKAIARVDNAHIFKTLKQECRDFPSFEVEEVDFGPMLGSGGFSNVYEVIAITLKAESESRKEGADVTDGTADATSGKGKAATFQDSIEEANPLGQNTDVHYDVNTARKIMSERCMRFGAARYAVKALRQDLDPLQRARGALDLGIEIKFLRVLWHPNIIKMRAYSTTPTWVSAETVIFLDRLYGTLDHKMEGWIETNNMIKGCCGGLMGGNPTAQRDLLKERLLVAYDLTAAYGYMHNLRLLYRDIKPENIGFDIRGDVKVFDFGLMKSLDDDLKVKGKYGYNLTAFTGSVPYMAPEIGWKEPYGTEADVFSFSMLLWEIVSLQVLDYTMQKYFIDVCKGGQRPPIGVGPGWPAVLKNIVTEGWDRQPTKRPTMKRIGMLLRGLLQDISADDSIMNRTQHMLNKSRRSMHGRGDGSGRGGAGGAGKRGLTGSRGESMHNLDMDLKDLTGGDP